MSKWNRELIHKEALKYQTKKDFRKYSRGAYEAAVRNNLITNICSHMDVIRERWTTDSVILEALKYKTKVDFSKDSVGAYNFAIQNDILNDACRHMVSGHRKWFHENIKTEALKYNSRSEFKHGNSNAYNSARKLNIIDEVCIHMNLLNTQWSVNDLKTEALKYETRNDFKLGSYGAYQSAHRMNIINEISNHMIYAPGGFNPNTPGYVYYVRIDDIINNTSVWKIGITKRKRIQDRFYGDINLTTHSITVLQTWYFNDGYDAMKKEQSIIDSYKEHRYEGVSPLINTKTTEMFCVDIFGIGLRKCDEQGEPSE